MKNLLVVICLIIISNTSYSQNYNNAHAYNIDLSEINVIDIERNFGPVWNVIFINNQNKIVFTRGKNGSNKIVVKDLSTMRDLVSFKGSKLYAVSPDGNRVFYDNNIYDIKQRKTFPINANIYNHASWQNGTIAWIDDEKIISYKNINSERPYSEYYFYLDLNDLQIKRMDKSEVNTTFQKLKKLKNNHKNFYLYTRGTNDVMIQGKTTPYSKSILYSKNGYPIKMIWSSSNLEYLVVRKYSQRYTNKYELVLYKLKSKENNTQLYFKASNPTQWFDDNFKKSFAETNGVNIWCDVYKAKTNPLNNKVIGPDKNSHMGTMKIIKSINNNKEIGLMIGNHKKDLKSGYIITNFRKSKSSKDRNGAWATLSEWNPNK